MCNVTVPLDAQEPGLTDLSEGTPDPAAKNWERQCSVIDDPTTCSIVQSLFVSKTVDGEEQTVGRILQIIVLYVTETDTDTRVAHLSMNLPLGVDLRAGAIVRVDEGEDFVLPYLRCLESGCAISRVIDDQLLLQMQLGTQLFVGFRPWGTTQTTVVPSSLIGFTRAFSFIE